MYKLEVGIYIENDVVAIRGQRRGQDPGEELHMAAKEGLHWRL